VLTSLAHPRKILLVVLQTGKWGKAKDLASLSRMEEGQLTCLNAGIYEIFHGYNVDVTVVYL
jgi:hypothetical protein